MKKQTFFRTLVFMLGLALLFFVGFSSCEKDGIEAETALASAAGQTTSNGDSDGKVTGRQVGSCECEFKIYSIDGNPASGKHLEMIARTQQDECSSNCPWADAIYGNCFLSIPGYSTACTNNISGGNISFLFPSKWMPFNCLIPSDSNFIKNLYLWEWSSTCTGQGGISGEIVYGVRCRDINCSSDWEYSASTVFTIPNGGSESFYIDLAGSCGCSPTIE